MAITGFCWGGRITWLYSAHNPAVKVGVAWYGRFTGAVNAMTPTHPYEIAEKLNAPHALRVDYRPGYRKDAAPTARAA